MTYIFPLVIIGVFLIAYLVYMKFYYPKFRDESLQFQNEFDNEWRENKEDILNELFSNPNKFKLITEVTKGDKVIGIISGQLPESFKSKALDTVVGAVTFTGKVDMSHSYLVATDKGVHYTRFDGEKCFLNEVFNYNQITQKKMNKNSFTFVYKDEKFSFNTEEIISGYPRFNVHERSRTATTNDRSTNYFVREYLAYEITENIEFKNSNGFIPKFHTNMLKASKERVKDTEVRKYLMSEFKKKLGILS